LNKEFNFTCDVCANEINHKHENYITEEQDALSQIWVGNCFCNPPYSRKLAKLFIKKAYESSLNGTLVVMLIPARTDTIAFHKYIYKKSNVEIRFLKGRLKFVGAKHKAPFPSMIVIFKSGKE
jgi:site-specific DNA-methyltransferase (adenine-specific)